MIPTEVAWWGLCARGRPAHRERTGHPGRGNHVFKSQESKLTVNSPGWTGKQLAGRGWEDPPGLRQENGGPGRPHLLQVD